MAETKITLDPKYNNPGRVVDTVPEDSLFRILKSLCTGPEYASSTFQSFVDDVLKILINYPTEMDNELDADERAKRGVAGPNKVVSASTI